MSVQVGVRPCIPLRQKRVIVMVSRNGKLLAKSDVGFRFLWDVLFLQPSGCKDT